MPTRTTRRKRPSGPSGPRPKTPRIELHDARIPEWRAAAEKVGLPLAAWVRLACERLAAK